MRAPWEGDARVLDGTACAAQIKDELRGRVQALREKGVVPGLGTVLVGEDPGSVAYVAGKHRDCAEVGIESIRVDLPAEASQEEILAAVEKLNPLARVSSFSCHFLAALIRIEFSRRSIRIRTPMVCTRQILGDLCCGGARLLPLLCHARRALSSS